MGNKSKAKTQQRRSGATPAAVLDAFFPEVIRLGEIEIEPVSLGHFLALERIGSPIVEGEAGFKRASLEDCARALFLLSLPTDRAIHLARLPEELEAGFAAFCARIPGGEIRHLANKIVSQLNAAFATVVPSKTEEGPGGESPLEGSQPSPPESAGV